MFWRSSKTVISALLPLALVACGDKSGADPRTQIPVVRAAVVQEAGQAARSFTGVVTARVQSDLGFRVAGKVLARLVDAGQPVQRGQVLMRIDPLDYQLAAQAQQQAVTAARARAAQSAADAARYRDLRGSGAIAESAYELAQAAADTAQAQLAAAIAQAKVAENASGYTELLANADGIVTETLAEPGQVVSAGQVTVRLAQAGQREALIQLPETLRPALGSVAQAAQFGHEGAPQPAKLRQIAGSADRLTRTFEARYVLEGELANAPLGSTVVLRLNATAGASPHAPLWQVPLAAVFDGGKGTGVWVIRGVPAKVAWQAVKVQQIDDASASVTGQFKAGDQVVALGAHLLHDGAAVRVAGSADAAGVTTPAAAAAQLQGARP